MLFFSLKIVRFQSLHEAIIGPVCAGPHDAAFVKMADVKCVFTL